MHQVDNWQLDKIWKEIEFSYVQQKVNEIYFFISFTISKWLLTIVHVIILQIRVWKKWYSVCAYEWVWEDKDKRRNKHPRNCKVHEGEQPTAHTKLCKNYFPYLVTNEWIKLIYRYKKSEPVISNLASSLHIHMIMYFFLFSLRMGTVFNIQCIYSLYVISSFNMYNTN